MKITKDTIKIVILFILTIEIFFIPIRTAGAMVGIGGLLMILAADKMGIANNIIVENFFGINITIAIGLAYMTIVNLVFVILMVANYWWPKYEKFLRWLCKKAGVKEAWK